MWYMIDYENVHEEGLYGIEMLKEDDKIFVFYNMGDKENIENSKLKKAAEKGISIQYVVLYKTGKNALDFYIASKIGEICGQGTQQDIAVISRDKGYRALCEYWMYVADIRKRIILRDTIYHALFDFEFDQMSSNYSCSDFKGIYLHCIKQYGRRMGCELYWNLKKYMEIRSDYVNVSNMRDQRKYYVVLRGYRPGIYDTVNDYESNIIGCSNAFGKVFSSYAQAEGFFLEYMAGSCLAVSTASINELWNDFCYHVHQNLQYENKTIVNGNLVGYVRGGFHADTRRFYSFWIIASKDGIVMKMKNIIHENKKIKKIGAVGGEILACKAVLTYALKHEYQGIDMYCSHIKVADWIERDELTDKLPYHLHAVIGKAKERLQVTAVHFQ